MSSTAKINHPIMRENVFQKPGQTNCYLFLNCTKTMQYANIASERLATRIIIIQVAKSVGLMG